MDLNKNVLIEDVLIEDVLSIILSYVDIRNMLVCKQWMKIMLTLSYKCKGCNKITHYNGESLWFTHAIYNLPCHAFYDHTFMLSYSNRWIKYNSLNTIRQCRGICLDAVTILGDHVKNVHKAYRTTKIFAAAIKTYACAIRFIDENELTQELVMLALSNKRMVLQYIPKKYHTNDNINTALKNNGLNLQFVLKPIILNDCYTAVKNNGLALEFVPDPFIEKCIFKALKNNGTALRHVPHHLITEKMCLCALNSSINAAIHVPKKYHYLFEHYKHNYSKLRYLQKNGFIRDIRL